MQANRLLIFREVARAGSLGKAAKQLGWTQPAVGQHMRALEVELGHPLLLRSSQGVTLTEAGTALLARADELAAVLEAAAREQQEFHELARGTVRIAVFGSAGATLIPEVMARLHERQPAIDILLTEAEPDEAIALLAAGRVDIAVLFRYPPEREPLPAGMTELRLGEEAVRLVVPAVSGIDEDVALAELASESWVAGCPRCSGHLIDVCRGAGFMPRIQHSTEDYVIVQNLVAAGQGIALLPAAALTAFLHPGVRVIDDSVFGVRQLSLAFRSAVARIPLVAATLDALAQGSAGAPVSRRVN